MLKITGRLGLLLGVTCLFHPLGAFAAQPLPHHIPYQWKNVQIVGGGFVDGFEFSPAAKNLVYARTDIGGAYRWDQDHQRWIPLMDWIPATDWNLMGAESVGVDPVDPNRVYVAAGTYTNSWAGNGAILRSSDQGRSWKETSLPFQVGGNMDGRFAGERLAVDPNDHSVIYFGSRDNGLWRSTDFGATWNQVASFPVTGETNGVGTVFVLFKKDSGKPGQTTPDVYVGVQQNGPSLYQSTDAGATWTPMESQPTGLLPNHGMFGAADSIYFTYGNAPGPNGMSAGAVWKYDTRSGVWTNVSPIPTGQPGSSGYGGLAIDAEHPDTVMVSTMDRWNPGDTIFRSLDGGRTWNDIGPQSTRSAAISPWVTFGADKASFGWWIGALAIDPFNSNHIVYGTGATIWASHDITQADQKQPTHWAVGARGLEETAVLHLMSPPAGAPLFSSLGDIGSYRHANLDVSPPDGMPLPVLFNATLAYAQQHPNMIVRTGSGKNGVFGVLSLDNGVSWKPFPTMPDGTRGGGPVAISSDGKTIVWSPQGAVPSVSNDNGQTWNPVQGLSAASDLAADGVNPSVFYALDSRSGALYTSQDGGKSFSVTHTFAGGKNSLTVDPSIDGDLWVVSNGTVEHCPDGAQQAIPVDAIQDVAAFGIGKSAPGHAQPALYALGTVDNLGGVYRSIDGGATWDCITDPQHEYAARDVVIGDPRVFGRVYVGTNGRGILYGDPATGTEKK